MPLERVDEYSTPNKCIYYGSIERYAVYFLMLLAGMGFDIVYINPFEKPDCLDLLGAELSVRNTRYPIGSFNDRASKGQAIHQIDSVTLGFRQEVEKTVFTDSGLFRQWQFKHGGTTESMFLNATVEDLENNWDAEARVRQGFVVVGKKVKIPTLFYEVDGVHSDENEYCAFVGKFVGGKDTLLISGKPEELLDITISEDDVLKISFCQRGDGSFDRDMLKALPFYRYAPYNDDTEDFILDKINETLSDSTLFSRPIVEKRDKVEFVAMCLQLNKKLMYMIDTYDFPFGIPKMTSIEKAVLYGRTMTESVKKFIVFQLTVNVTTIALSLIAPLIGYKEPFTIIQILWINLIMDTLAALAFGEEPTLARYMKRQPIGRKEHILTNYMKSAIGVSGAFIAVVSAGILANLGGVQNILDLSGSEEVLTFMFTFFIYAVIFNSLNTRSHGFNVLEHIGQNKKFIYVMTSIAVVQSVIIEFGGHVFSTVPLDLKHFGMALVLAFLIVPVDMARKLLVGSYRE